MLLSEKPVGETVAEAIFQPFDKIIILSLIRPLFKDNDMREILGAIHRRRRQFCALGAGLAMACLTTAALAAGPFDGRYGGLISRERGDTGTCGAEKSETRVTVSDGKFTYTWNPAFHVVVTVTIEPDGTVSGSQMWGRGNLVKVTGHATHDTLDVMFESTYCARHFALKRSI